MQDLSERKLNDKTSDNVVNLEDFDFDILNDDSDEEQKDSPIEADVDSNAVSFDAIIEQNKVTGPEEISPLNQELKEEYLEEDDEYEIAENKSSVSQSDNTDDFLSQVDEFLSDDFLANVELDDEQQKLLVDDSQMTNEEKDQIGDAFNYAELGLNEQDNFGANGGNDTLKVLFQKENGGQGTSGKQFGPDGEFTVGDNVPLAHPTLGKNKKVMIAASLAGVVLISLVAGNVFKPKSANMNLNPNVAPISSDGGNLVPNSPQEFTEEEAEEGIQSDFQNNNLDAAPRAANSPTEAQPNRDMGKAVSDIFLSEPVSTSISKVGWEVPEDLAYNDSFRRYLQMAGRNLKLNLQNNLLLATEMAYSNKVVVDLNVGRGGDLRSSNISVSSGSKQIDTIVLQSVKETLKYLKVPSSEISGDSFAATLIINF
jgi:outer membrane biosynthesis protein TonB